jgi:hypothetical protein
MVVGPKGREEGGGANPSMFIVEAGGEVGGGRAF